MPSPLDPMDPTGIASFLDTPEIRRQRMFDTLGGIGAALIQASGPSTQPQDFGSLVAAGLAGGALAGRGSEDRYLKRAMVGSQVAKNQSEIANEKAWRGMFEPGAAVASAAPGGAAPAPQTAGGDPATVIGNIEGSGKYDTIGPVTVVNGKPSKPYGKYGVMDFNVGPWTQEILGTQMTPEQFLADSKAQDTVFQVKFNEYAKKFGSKEAAARAWFAGEVGMNNPNAKDVLGTTVAGYGQKFTAGMGGPQIAQGDGSGQPVQQAQYQPPQPRTMQDVINSMPPGVRQMVGAMGRKDGMAQVLKYADPGSEAVLDTQTGGVVFIPKTMVGRDPRFQPVEGAKLEVERGNLANRQRATDNTIANSDVVLGPDGKPMVNETAVGAKKAISAAQGTDPASKITFELAQDAIKRNSDWQKEALQAQSSVNRLGALNTLLDQVTTGQFKGTTTQIKAIAKGAGFDLGAMGVTDDVGPAQAVVALTNLMALENRSPAGGAGMPGAMSDADRAFLQAASPSITKDPTGNKILVAIKRGDLQRQIDIAKYAREYIKSADFKTNPAGLDDYIAEKVGQKNYYDASLLPQQSVAPPGTIPPPPAGFTAPGGAAAPSGAPQPPAGFRIVQ